MLCLLLAGIAGAETKTSLNGGLYPQFIVNAAGSSFFAMAGEADITARFSTKTRDIASAALQLWASSMMNDWTMGMHYGQAYVLVPLGLRLPTLKIGQAVIPFGLLADYDTHSQIIQTPYARTLSLRIDPGVGFQGDLARIFYSFWVSNGNGPYALDNDAGKVFSARVAPKFLLGDAEATLGISGLAGSLPYWRLDSMMHMMDGPHAYRQKYRFALDNTTDWGPLTLHLEGVAGKDGVQTTNDKGQTTNSWALLGTTVYGYYVEGRYAVTNWLEALAMYDDYSVAGQGSHGSAAGGFTLTHPQLSALNLQVFYQADLMNTAMMNERSWNVTTQLTYRF